LAAVVSEDLCNATAMPAEDPDAKWPNLILMEIPQ
jgi:hypothetical protein